MPQDQDPLNIVVVGASFAGLSVAHEFLDKTITRLHTSPAVPPYRIVLISPSSHIYWNIGAPRTIVAGNLIKESEAFVPIEPGFARHRSEEWLFVQGVCHSWDPENRDISVESIGDIAQNRCTQLANERNSTGLGRHPAKSPVVTATPSTPSFANGIQQSIPYHALILATGTSAHSDLLSLHGPHEYTVQAIRDFQARLPLARSIIVCGGGASGVECAGQLATYLNHQSLVPNWLAGQQQANLEGLIDTPVKSITLITSTNRLLPGLNPKISKQAERYLRSLGVTIVKDVRVMNSSTFSLTPSDERKPAALKTRVELSDRSVMICDAYVAATGVSPNTSYAPLNLLNSEGYIQTDVRTLRVPGAGDRVYCLGDCSSYSANYVLDVYAAVAPLMHNLGNDLIGYELWLANRYGGNDAQIEELKRDDVIFDRKDHSGDSQLCPITRRGGVGVLFGFVLPRFMVYFLKANDYRVHKGKAVVVDGNNPYPG